MKVDQSFLEQFPNILNEENISQETNLININPNLIRLDREADISTARSRNINLSNDQNQQGFVEANLIPRPGIKHLIQIK